MPGLLLATPRYDYRSADAAAAAYDVARARTWWRVLPIFVLFVWQTYRFAAAHRHPDPVTERLNRLFDPIFASFTLCFAAVFLTMVLIWVHRRTLRRPGPGADADAWLAATRDNVVREGRFLLAAGALGAALVAGAGVFATRIIDADAGWDLPVALVLPALSVVGFNLATGLRDVYRPDRVLAAPGTAAPAWPPRTYVGYAFGCALIFIGSVAAFLGDGVPGVRIFGDSGEPGEGPGFEAPVVVARLAALPFIAGAAVALGWVLVALAARTARGRLAVLTTGALLTAWVGALAEPATGHSDRWLWYGAAPGLLIVLGVVAWTRRPANGRRKVA